MKKNLALFTLAVLATACGGGGGTGADGLASNISSQFIDAPVKGLDYTGSAGSTGSTLANGVFSCKSGEKMTFKIKGMTIGTATCGNKVFISDVEPARTGMTTTQLGQILQSLAFGTGVAGAQLDLSSVPDLSGKSISSLDVSSGDAAFTADVWAELGAASFSHLGADAPASGGDIVTAAASATHIATSVAANSTLSTDDKAVLDSLDSDNKYLKMRGTRTSGDPSYCDDFVLGTAKVVRYGSNPNYYYRFEPKDFSYFHGDPASSEPSASASTGAITCPVDSDEDDDNYCYTEDADLLPKPKVISSSTLNLVGGNYYVLEPNEPLELSANQWYVSTIARVLGGTYEFKLTYDDALSDSSGEHVFKGSFVDDFVDVTDAAEGGATEEEAYVITSVTRYRCAYDIKGVQADVDFDDL